MAKRQDMAKTLSEIIDIDVNEIIDDVNHSQESEISERYRIRLDDDTFYVKNSYQYFKKTPVHYLSSNPSFEKSLYNQKIALYHILTCQNTNFNLAQTMADCIYCKGHENEIAEFLFENELVESHDNSSVNVTAKGIEYLNSISWIEYYLIFLDRFDFREFDEFMKVDFWNSALEFLDTHYNLAVKRHDLTGQFDAQSSKALYHILTRDMRNALDEEMKLFIIRLNPVHESPDELIFHEALNPVNVSNLNSLLEICEIDDAEKLFIKNWDELDLENPVISKRDSLKYLMDALKLDNLDDLNRSAEKYYLMENV